MGLEHAEQYANNYYQRSAEIESPIIYGLTFTERCEREVDAVLSAIEIKEADKVLDLGAGAGEHARIMREKTGANIDASDISTDLMRQAEERDKVTQATRGRIKWIVADMGKLDETPQIPKGAYDAITIMGSSFLYMPSREDNLNALKGFYERLKEGGKIAMQFRWSPLSNHKPGPPAKTPLPNYVNDKVTPDNPEDIAQFGQKMDVIRDPETGESVYYYGFAGEHPELDFEGVEHTRYARMYVDPEWKVHDLGYAHITDFREHNVDTLAKLMREAGFKNIEVKEESFTPAGVLPQKNNFVIVGEK